MTPEWNIAMIGLGITKRPPLPDGKIAPEPEQSKKKVFVTHTCVICAQVFTAQAGGTHRRYCSHHCSLEAGRRRTKEFKRRMVEAGIPVPRW